MNDSSTISSALQRLIAAHAFTVRTQPREIACAFALGRSAVRTANPYIILSPDVAMESTPQIMTVPEDISAPVVFCGPEGELLHDVVILAGGNPTGPEGDWALMRAVAWELDETRLHVAWDGSLNSPIRIVRDEARANSEWVLGQPFDELPVPGHVVLAGQAHRAGRTCASLVLEGGEDT